MAAQPTSMKRYKGPPRAFVSACVLAGWLFALGDDTSFQKKHKVKEEYEEGVGMKGQSRAKQSKAKQRKKERKKRGKKRKEKIRWRHTLFDVRKAQGSAFRNGGKISSCCLRAFLRWWPRFRLTGWNPTLLPCSTSWFCWFITFYIHPHLLVYFFLFYYLQHQPSATLPTAS